MENAYETPPNWEGDSLSEFIGQAIKNILGSFVVMHDEYERLAGIDNAYKSVIENLHKNPDWFIWFFLCRAHGSFRGAARMALSGQVSETYPLLRVTMENALYGFYLATHEESQETWLRRHDDEECLKKVKNEFKNSNLLKCLQLADSNTHDIAKYLYQETIDWGVHPNERSLSQQLINSKRTATTFDTKFGYLLPEGLPFELSIKRTSQVGVCCLKIF